MYLSEIYCRGYSGEDPPLPIPNREVKLTIADGTDPPVGRVGSRGSSKPRASRDARGFFCILSRHSLHCHFERSREIFSVIPRPCPAPAAIEPSFHGLSVESALRHSGSMMLLLQFRLESAETERHRGLDEPTSPFTSRGARNVGGQCSSCRFASPPPARGPRTFPFPHTSPHRSSNRRSPPLWPATPSVPAWLPSCCGGRVATKSPGKRAFPPLFRRGRPHFPCHSKHPIPCYFEHPFPCHFERSREISSVMTDNHYLPLLRRDTVFITPSAPSPDQTERGSTFPSFHRGPALSRPRTFQPPDSNRLTLKCLHFFSWKVPRKNMPPSRPSFANSCDSTTSDTKNGRWRGSHDTHADKQKETGRCSAQRSAQSCPDR